MFFTLSPEQINVIKNNTFPTFEQVDIKNVILKTVGSDSDLKVTLEIKESLSLLKIFNNKKTQKLMRMKIFEILSSDMKEDVLAAQTIPELEEIIKSYGVYNVVLSPADDFLGDKKNIYKHKISANNYVNLQYIKNIVLPEPVIKFLSLGVVFYYDLETYVKEEKIAPEFIDKNILSSNIFVFDLVKDNRAVDDCVNDLRLVKSIFNRQANSNQSNLVMSSKNVNLRDPSQFQEMAEDRIYFAQESGLNTLNSLNSDLELDTNVVKILSEKTKKIKLDTYFSNAFYSRNINGNLSFLFNLDYQSLIQNNSAYKQQIINSSLKDQFSKQIKLVSLKIQRRRIKKLGDTNKSKIYYFNDTITNITEGSDSDDGLLKPVKKEIGFIKEKALYFDRDLDSRIRTFEVVDKQVYDLKTGLYQYGVEITLIDTFNNYISDNLRNSFDDLNKLRLYLKDTENLIKIEKKYNGSDVISTQTGYYDPTTTSFSREFVEKVFPEKHAKNVSNSITNFIALMNIFGIKMATSTSGLDLAKTFTTLLIPNFSNAENISLFIKTYERFVNQIQKIIASNNSSEIKLNHWFINDYVDAEKDINVGYEYIINEDEEGLGSVTADQMRQIVLENIYKYSRENSIRDSEYDLVKYGYIAPKTIRTKDRVLDLNDIIDSPESLSQYDFIEAEMDIKRLNGLGDVNLKPATRDDPNLPDIRQQNFNLKAASLLNEFSVTINNIFDEKPKKIDLIKDSSDYEAAYNANADAAYLLIAMSKQFDLKKSKFKYFEREQEDFLSIERVLKRNKEYKSNIPLHLSLLMNNEGKILKAEDNYLTTLDLNSIFNLMYNTIQKIEYLEYNKNATGLLDLKNEKWSLLTEEKIRQIDGDNQLILCRLSLYQNYLLKIVNFDQIALPIYNKYFILSGLDPKMSFRAPRPADFENFFNNLRPIIDEKITNRLEKPFEPPALPEKLPDIKLPPVVSNFLDNIRNPAVDSLVAKITPVNPQLNIPVKELKTSLSPASTVLAREIIKPTTLVAQTMPNPNTIKIEPPSNIAGAPPFITKAAERQNTVNTGASKPTQQVTPAAKPAQVAAQTLANQPKAQQSPAPPMQNVSKATSSSPPVAVRSPQAKPASKTTNVGVKGKIGR
jgi:hypothetical protein